MKKFILTLTAIFICTIAYAHTINWHVGDTILETTTCNSGDSITPPSPPYKYGYHFVEWAPYSARIEYLESTGTQWIDTGFVANQDTHIKVKYSTINNTGDAAILGSRQSYYSRAFYLAVGFNGNPNYYFINYNNWYNTPVIEVRDIPTVIDLDRNRFFINDVLSFTSDRYSGFTTPGSIWLFDCQGISTPAKGLRIYYTQIYDNDILVRDFIPVLDLDDVPCMYDKIEKKCYYNQGTGQFIAGPVIGGE